MRRIRKDSSSSPNNFTFKAHASAHDAGPEPPYMMNLEDIAAFAELETVSRESVWQNFERLAAFIFEKK
jgi:hypothetical protein